MNKPQFELIRTALQTSIRDLERDGDSLPDPKALIGACQALADDPSPALLQALGMFAVGCLLAQLKSTLIAESEIARLLHRLGN